MKPSRWKEMLMLCLAKILFGREINSGFRLLSTHWQDPDILPVGFMATQAEVDLIRQLGAGTWFLTFCGGNAL
jgi:hypothetical protein